MSRESDLTQLWLKRVESELSQVSKFGIWVESVCQSRKVKCWVESELSHLDGHMSQSRVNPKNLSRAQPCIQVSSLNLWMINPDVMKVKMKVIELVS